MQTKALAFTIACIALFCTIVTNGSSTDILSQAEFDKLYPENPAVESYAPSGQTMDLRPPKSGERLFVPGDSPIVQRASKATRLHVLFAMRVSGSARQLLSTQVYEDYQLHEFVIRNVRRGHGQYPPEMYWGVGEDGEDGMPSVLTFTQSATSTQLVDRQPLTGGANSSTVALIDLDRDGVLELIIGSCPSDPGGGITTFHVHPNGKLEEIDEADSVGGNFALRDFDQDGRMDIETVAIIQDGGFRCNLFSHSSLSTFDPATKSWFPSNHRLTSLVSSERAFYKAYLAAARTYEVQAARMSDTDAEQLQWNSDDRQLMRWRGKAYRVGGFDADTIEALLLSWESD